MADYSSMRALDVWYDRIDLDRVLKVMTDRSGGGARQATSRAGAAQKPSREPVSKTGRAPRFGAKDQGRPAADLPSHRGTGPGLTTGYVEALEGYRKSLPDHIRVLFDRYRLFDIAIKVVGVGSVGTDCAVGLFMAAEDDPMFLQVKEARKSVLEPYAGKSLTRTRASGSWRPAPHAVGKRHFPRLDDVDVNGRDYYFRQLRDAKISAIPEDWDLTTLREYRQALRLGAGTGACPIRRPGEDCWLHGVQHDVRRRDLRVRGRIRRSERSRLSRLCQSDPRRSNSGCVRGLSHRPDGLRRVRLPPRQADALPVFLARNLLVLDVERRSSNDTVEVLEIISHRLHPFLARQCLGEADERGPHSPHHLNRIRAEVPDLVEREAEIVLQVGVGNTSRKAPLSSTA